MTAYAVLSGATDGHDRTVKIRISDLPQPVKQGVINQVIQQIAEEDADAAWVPIARKP